MMANTEDNDGGTPATLRNERSQQNYDVESLRGLVACHGTLVLNTLVSRMALLLGAAATKCHGLGNELFIGCIGHRLREHRRVMSSPQGTCTTSVAEVSECLNCNLP